MTSSASVGTGIALPLALDFNKKHRKGGIRALLDYLKSRNVSEDVAHQVQKILINQYGDYSVAGRLDSLFESSARVWHPHRGEEAEFLHFLNRIIDGPMDDVLLSKEDVGGIDPYGRHVTVKKAHIRKYKAHRSGMSQVKVIRRKPKKAKIRKQKVKKPKIRRVKSPKLRKVSRRVHEGIGYADDSDGRGRGLSGGSPYGSDGRLPSAENTQCPKCGSPSFQENADGSKTCDRCRSTYGLPYLTGANTNQGTWGNVRLPGGAIGTNEVRITCLDTNLYEITVNGATTTHTRPVMPEALRHMVSPFGSMYKLKLNSVLEWLWHKAKPGDTLVFDHVGKAKYVVGNSGFKYNMED